MEYTLKRKLSKNGRRDPWFGSIIIFRSPEILCLPALKRYFFSSSEEVRGRVVYSRSRDMGLGDQGCFKELDCADASADALEIHV